MSNYISSYNINIQLDHNESKIYNKKNNIFNNQSHFMNNFLTNKKTIYCKNCGKYGHPYKKCKEPVTSYGIICIRFINKLNNKLIKYKNLSNVNNIKIEYLLIQRKHTLGYTEFIRGKYFISDIYSIIILFKQMIQEEIDSILENNFDYHWNTLWVNKINKSSIYKSEYESSKKKFNYLKSNKHDNINLDYIKKNITPLFSDKEWGMPKGRRNNYEDPLQCANREFQEETSYIDTEYEMFKDTKKYIEIFNGTNGIKYQHVYYVANCITPRIPILNANSSFKSNEIGNITWKSFEDTCNILRPYHTEKIRIINEIHNYLTNKLIKKK